MKRLICLFMAFPIMLMLSLSAFASETRSGETWTLSFTGSTSIYTGNLWSSQDDFSVDTPVFTNSGYSSPPDGYTLIGYASRGEDARNRSLKYYIYAPVGTQKLCTFFTNNDTDIHINNSFSSGNLFILYNISTSSNTTGATTYTGYKTSMNWNNYYKLVSSVPFADRDGNVITPPDYLSCELNVLTTTHFLYFNTSVSNDYSGDVKYYVFPSSVDLSSNSTFVSSGSTAYFSDPDNTASQSLISRGFKWYVDKQLQVLDFYGIIDTSNSTDYTLNYSSSSYTAVFNPSQISPVYSFLGSAAPDKSLMLDLKSVGRSGVFAQDSLCLVAVVQNGSSYSYSRYDFNIATILSNSGTIVNSTHINPTFPAPDPQVSDLQGLADYLKNLANLDNQNSSIRDRNFIAMLTAMPWADYIGTGFGSQLPNLSFYLDSLFDSLFEKYTAPSEEQINFLVNEVNEERAYLREKLAFVADVKSEVFFIQSTFISAGDNPRPFKVTLPDFMMGYTTSEHQEALVRYDLIDNTTRQAMHDVIIVFCTLAVVMHIWHTLPATVGNMPRE